MTSYAFWNNKGGVGKSFLAFVAATEYAHANPDSDVYVIDLCPQANLSEVLLGGVDKGSRGLSDLLDQDVYEHRVSIAGYLEERLSSPFKMVSDPLRFVSEPHSWNPAIPQNLYLVCGDNLLEVQSEAMRQTSQLAIPVDSWKKVIEWVKDLVLALRAESAPRDAVFFIDCNPSFSIYTQMALVAAEDLVIPFTADESSRRGFENILALLYGYESGRSSIYSSLSFSRRATEHSVQLPKVHSLISNRVTLYKGGASSAFRAVMERIQRMVDDVHKRHRSYFSNPADKPSDSIIEIPDYHSACVVATARAIPLFSLQHGQHKIGSEVVQLNKVTLEPYKKALRKFVSNL